jgi:hypothetical protein
MFVLGIAVAVALLIPLVTFGSYKRLVIESKFHWGWVLAVSIAIQLFLEFYDLPRRYWDGLGYWLLVGSFVLLLAFVARNFVLRGMSIVFIGIACNALVITLNQGMPVKLPPEWRDEKWAEASISHHPREDGEKLLVLSDIIIVREPVNNVLSFGDLILAVGLCDVAFHLSRNPKRAKRKAQRKVARMAARS